MSELIETNEFAVVLVCDSATRDVIAAIRRDLPVSPYYESIPHITLLRGIRSATHISDEQLVNGVRELLDVNQLRQVRFAPKKVVNRFNHIYKTTAAIGVQVPRKLRLLRNQFMRALRDNGFRVEPIEKLVYVPHLTIRLGVTLRGPAKAQAEGRLRQIGTIGCGAIAILRICRQDGERAVRMVMVEQY
jgi:2'-5' RNA ligase